MKRKIISILIIMVLMVSICNFKVVSVAESEACQISLVPK
jgi:hypothetical protein